MINNFYFLSESFGQLGPVIGWISLLIFLIVVEATTAQMVCLWFIIGTIPALILAACNVPFLYQILAFVVTTAIAFIVTKPFVKKFTGRIGEKTNVDALIGAVGVVTKEIPEDNSGEVSVRYQTWNAVSENNSVILVDTKVEIIEVSGNKLIVRIKED